jgi:hypothetical protein
LYQPQFGHTVCGFFVVLHRGQVLRDGTASFMFAERFARPRAFDFFFFGTAMVTFTSVTEFRCGLPLRAHSL